MSARSDLLATTVFKHVEGLFDSVMAIPSAGLRAVDFTDLRDVGDGLELVSRYVDRFDIGFFGLRADETQLIDGLERIGAANGRLFIVTLGADGSIALGSTRRIASPRCRSRASSIRPARATASRQDFSRSIVPRGMSHTRCARSLRSGAHDSHLGAS